MRQMNTARSSPREFIRKVQDALFIFDLILAAYDLRFLVDHIKTCMDHQRNPALYLLCSCTITF